jgi:hypothetical protein
MANAGAFIPRAQITHDAEPTLFRFAVAFANRQKMFNSGLIHPDHNQQASLLITDSRRQVNPIRIEVDDLRLRQRALASRLVFDLELLIEPRDRRRRERRLGPQQGPQGRLEIPRRQPFDELFGKQFVHRLGPFLVRLDQLGLKAFPFWLNAHARDLDGHRPAAQGQCPFRQIAIAMATPWFTSFIALAL